MNQKIRTILKQTKLDNEEGVALIISMFVVTVLFGLTACFSLASVGELNSSNRYRDSAEAFWVAEAGINRFIQNTAMLDDGDAAISFGENSVLLSKDDSDAAARVVTATATANGVQRAISVEFPAEPPTIFDNTISSGGGITLDGFIAAMSVDGQTRLTGAYDDQGTWVDADFESLEEGVDSEETTFEYPDVDSNGTPDEFADFIEYNRRYADYDYENFNGEYSEDELLYIPTNDTVNIWPDTDLAGVKVIFVEGTAPGTGDVNIWFDSTWQNDQNVTVISTGSVNYIQPLQSSSSNSQLNTISWSDYNEVAILYSKHSGVTYTHGAANYGSIISLSKTSGNLIANDDISLDLILVAKEFTYEDPIDEDGLVPPAFQGLINGGTTGYADTPVNWEEVWEVASE